MPHVNDLSQFISTEPKVKTTIIAWVMLALASTCMKVTLITDNFFTYHKLFLSNDYDYNLSNHKYKHCAMWKIDSDIHLDQKDALNYIFELISFNLFVKTAIDINLLGFSGFWDSFMNFWNEKC